MSSRCHGYSGLHYVACRRRHTCICTHKQTHTHTALSKFPDKVPCMSCHCIYFEWPRQRTTLYPITSCSNMHAISHSGLGNMYWRILFQNPWLTEDRSDSFFFFCCCFFWGGGKCTQTITVRQKSSYNPKGSIISLPAKNVIGSAA